jgi:D-alanine-D-alanine ligase
MDKIAMKMVLRQSGIHAIDYIWFTDREWGGGSGAGRDTLIERIETEIGYPAIVKPANLGSSVGISRARDRGELVRAVGEAARYSSRILVEKMIEPLREINCSVLGSPSDLRTSVCEEPLRSVGADTSGEILSYADKYMSGGNDASDRGRKTGLAGAKGTVSGGAKGAVSGGMSSTRRRIPADLPEAVSDEIRRLAAETFSVLGCEGVARVDFILDERTATGNADSADNAGNANNTVGTGTPKIYVNEINTIPGSLSFYLWEATGLSFGALLDALVGQALKRERDKEHKIVSYEANIFCMGSFGGGSGVKGGGGGGPKTGGGK